MVSMMKIYRFVYLADRRWRWAALLLALLAGNVYAIDLMAPFRGLKNLFGNDDDAMVVWQGPGQYIKIVEQDWDKDHRKAPRNEHPAQVTAPHMAVVLASLQGWRPEDSPESTRSVPLFTNEEISTFAPLLADALTKAGPKQDVVFATSGRHEAFSNDSTRTNAGRMFVTNGRLNIIFGDVLRPGTGDVNDISQYSEPHRAGKRLEPTSRDIILSKGVGINYYTIFDRARVDWAVIDVPTLVAAYRGPELITSPMPSVSASSPPGETLSQENRKLREELARLRKEEGGVSPSVAPAVVAQPPASGSQPADENATSSAGAPAASAADSLQKRLQLLKELHDKGLISDKEYDAKRKQIIDQI